MEGKTKHILFGVAIGGLAVYLACKYWFDREVKAGRLHVGNLPVSDGDNSSEPPMVAGAGNAMAEFGGGGPNYLKVGDKGREVIELQKTMNWFLPDDLQMDVDGLYTKSMKGGVNTMFAGTRALKDSGKGAIKKEFVQDVHTLIQNIQS
jgi:hypothetical protein